MTAVEEKVAAAGTDQATAKTKQRSGTIACSFSAWQEEKKAELCKHSKSDKLWWKQFRELSMQQQKLSSIPALKNSEGTWLLQPSEKADHFVDVFAAKCALPELHPSEYSPLDDRFPPQQAANITVSDAKEILEMLDVNSATASDQLPARILRRYAEQLAQPLLLLSLAILQTGRWPECWTEPWIIPLFKRKEPFLGKNYRGIHITPQVSKCAERLLGRMWLHMANNSSIIGNYQFAYRAEHGARDALAYAILKWLSLFAEGKKVGVHLADVSGAFDRVSTPRLLQKLRAKKVPEPLVTVKVISSWLRQRQAVVAVAGKRSKPMLISNSVYQGTVWGPPLWNIYYEDTQLASSKAGFDEIKYADDLSCFRAFDMKALSLKASAAVPANFTRGEMPTRSCSTPRKRAVRFFPLGIRQQQGNSLTF